MAYVTAGHKRPLMSMGEYDEGLSDDDEDCSGSAGSSGQDGDEGEDDEAAATHAVASEWPSHDHFGHSSRTGSSPPPMKRARTRSFDTLSAQETDAASTGDRLSVEADKLATALQSGVAAKAFSPTNASVRGYEGDIDADADADAIAVSSSSSSAASCSEDTVETAEEDGRDTDRHSSVIEMEHSSNEDEGINEMSHAAASRLTSSSLAARGRRSIPPPLARLLEAGVPIAAKSASGKPLKGAAKAKAQAKTMAALHAAAQEGRLRLGGATRGARRADDALIWLDHSTGRYVLDTVALGLAQGVYLEQRTIQAIAEAAKGLTPSVDFRDLHDAASAGDEACELEERERESEHTQRGSGELAARAMLDAHSEGSVHDPLDSDASGFTLSSPRHSHSRGSPDGAAAATRTSLGQVAFAYRPDAFADAGPHYTEWTAYRLKTHSLFLEHTDSSSGVVSRWQLSRGLDLSDDGYDTYAWARVRLAAEGDDAALLREWNDVMANACIPLSGGKVDLLHSGLDWSDFRWTTTGVTVRGVAYPLANFVWAMNQEESTAPTNAV
jgi:hypothetical protein